MFLQKDRDGKGEITMKKTKMTTKVLSLLLSVIMLFTMVSVGIIVPEITAAAADPISVSTIAQLNSAIATANSNGTGVQTVIKLSGPINYTGALAQLTPISNANILFDFNGNYIQIDYLVSGNYDDGQTHVQIPSENAGKTHVGTDTFTNGLIVVNAGSTLQIVNSKPGNICSMILRTDIADGRKNSTITHQASSSLIYSEGNLIIGSTDSSLNDFTLYAHSSARITNGDNPLLYGKKTANANAYTITVNNANATFKMYGGIVKASGVSRARRGGDNNLRVYAVNLNKCYSAEFYGGEVNLDDSPYDTYTGVRQSSTQASGGMNARVAAIRNNESYLYIFDVKSTVNTIAGSDTSNDNSWNTANIYVVNSSYPVNIFGGNLSFYARGDKGSDNSTATTHSYLVEGQYNIASGGKLQGASGTNYEHVETGRDATNTKTVGLYSVLIGDNGTAENGIDIFGYKTFRHYLANYSEATDKYFENSVIATYSDNVSYTPSTKEYLRNGYTQTGWQGKTHPGAAYKTTYDSTGGASLTTSDGGTLFLAPVWTENTYTIKYNWNDTVGANKVTDTSDCPTTYSITSTDTFGVPVRPGYEFGKVTDVGGITVTTYWEVIEATYPDTDTNKNCWPLGVYAKNQSLNGKNGNITLMPHWQEVEYTATFDYNGGTLSGAGSSSKTYNVNKVFQFPQGLQKDYYTFDNAYKVSKPDGSWALNNTTYAAGDTSTVGSWGNVIFEAQYTPISYTIEYNSNNGSDVGSDAPVTYTVESTDKLPAVSRKGFTFGGWYIADPNTILNNDSWKAGVKYENGEEIPLYTYPAGTELTNRHGNVTLKAYWTSTSSDLTLDIAENETITGDIPAKYPYATATLLPNPTKTGYIFNGWEVSSIDSDPDNNIQKGDILLPDVAGGQVSIPAKNLGALVLKPVWIAIKYDINFNSNNGSYAAPFQFDIESTIILPTVTRNGYDFTHWSVSSPNGNWSGNYYEGQTLKGMYGDITLEANWDMHEYVVTLDSNGGTGAPATLGFKLNANTTLPAPQLAGYDFAGWKVVNKDAASSWILGDVYTSELPRADVNGNDNYGNVTLEAQWTSKEYNIHYTSSGVTPADKTYHIDDEPFYAPASTLGGHSFLYWKVAADAGNWKKDDKIYAGDTISGKYGDVTFIAVFEANTYEIKFIDIDGTVLNADTEYTMEDTVDIPVYSRDGYTFGGWRITSLNNGGGWRDGSVYQPGQVDKGTCYGDVIFEPVLTATQYSIKFIPDGGTAYADLSYTIEAADTLPVPEKTGYDFAGWLVTAGEGSWTEGETVDGLTAVTGKYGNVTLKAQWTPKRYDITWVTGNGTHVTDGYFGSLPDYSGVDTSKPADAQYTYTFTGWTPALSEVNGEATYTAQYSKKLNSYTVTWKYETDEVSGVITDTASYNYGVHPVYNNGINPIKTSTDEEDHVWRFIGWVDESGNYLTADTVVTGNVTYTAEFKKVEAPRTVTWVIDGVSQETKWEVGEMPSFVGTPIKPDENGYKYTFTGWTPAITAVEANKDYTYVAEFARSAQTYTAEFDLNGGYYDGETEVSYNMISGLDMPKPERIGYSFSGWLLTAAESGNWKTGNVYEYDAYLNNWGNVSFVAQWTPVEYTLTVESDDGTTAEYKYNIESTDTLPEFTKDGFVLTSWTVISADGNWVAGDSVSADKALKGMYGDVTLQPVWTARLYKINWVCDGIIQTVEFSFGAEIVTYPPIKKAGYTAQWDKEVPVTMPAEDLTFNAVYTPVEYYLRFNVAGGSAVENFYYNITSAELTLPVPTRAGATFKGWKVSAGNGGWLKNKTYEGGMSLEGFYGNATLTAVWELDLYTVKWVAGDIVKETKWYHGATPSYDGTPYKSPDEFHSYVFSGWDKEITTVTADVTYTALFTATERMYTVKWNVDGYVIEQEYKYGETPVYTGERPVRPSTSEFDFDFSGWSPEVGIVTGDVTYVAQFDVFTKLLGLRVDKSAVFIDIGGDAVVTAILSPSTATVKDVEWFSSDESIATVDASGRIVGVGAGEAIIRVQSKDGAFKSYCVVTVAPIITEYVIISAGGLSTTRLPGEAIQLTATVMPDNATNKNVTWSSSNSAIASVDANGLVVFGEVTGTAVITAVADGYAVGTIEVTTTLNEDLVEDTVKTYLVMFMESTSKYVIAGTEFEAVNIVYKEGDTVEFTLTEPHFATANGVQMMRDTDGVFRITNIQKNYTILSMERADIGLEDTDKDDSSASKPSFFDRLKEFFRSILEFFRGLFGG